MFEDLSAVSVFLMTASLLVFILMLKTVFSFRKFVSEKTRSLEHGITKLESEAFVLKHDLEDLQEQASEKIDFDYLDKRIDGLVKLIGKSSVK